MDCASAECEIVVLEASFELEYVVENAALVELVAGVAPWHIVVLLVVAFDAASVAYAFDLVAFEHVAVDEIASDVEIEDAAFDAAQGVADLFVHPFVDVAAVRFDGAVAVLHAETLPVGELQDALCAADASVAGAVDFAYAGVASFVHVVDVECSLASSADLVGDEILVA